MDSSTSRIARVSWRRLGSTIWTKSPSCNPIFSIESSLKQTQELSPYGPESEICNRMNNTMNLALGSDFLGVAQHMNVHRNLLFIITTFDNCRYLNIESDVLCIVDSFSFSFFQNLREFFFLFFSIFRFLPTLKYLQIALDKASVLLTKQWLTQLRSYNLIQQILNNIVQLKLHERLESIILITDKIYTSPEYKLIDEGIYLKDVIKSSRIELLINNNSRQNHEQSMHIPQPFIRPGVYWQHHAN